MSLAAASVSVGTAGAASGVRVLQVTHAAALALNRAAVAGNVCGRGPNGPISFRGPLRDRNLRQAQYRGTLYALADFPCPQTGLTDEPIQFRKRLHGYWYVIGDSGGFAAGRGFCRIPPAVRSAWGSEYASPNC